MRLRRPPHPHLSLVPRGDRWHIARRALDDRGFVVGLVGRRSYPTKRAARAMLDLCLTACFRARYLGGYRAV